MKLSCVDFALASFSKTCTRASVDNSINFHNRAWLFGSNVLATGPGCSLLLSPNMSWVASVMRSGATQMPDSWAAMQLIAFHIKFILRARGAMRRSSTLLWLHDLHDFSVFIHPKMVHESGCYIGILFTRGLRVNISSSGCTWEGISESPMPPKTC